MVVAAGVLFALGVVWFPRLLGAAAGPEVELVTLLKTIERDGFEVEVAGQALQGKRVHYQRLSIQVDLPRREATVTATLDFTGKYGQVEVSSLGAERVVFVQRGYEWVARDGYAPRLSGVVGALEARRAALQAGNRAGLERLLGPAADAGLEAEVESWLALLERRMRVEAWYIRVERDTALVTEEFKLDAFGRDRPLQLRGPRRLELRLSPTPAGEFFFFPGGLM